VKRDTFDRGAEPGAPPQAEWGMELVPITAAILFTLQAAGEASLPHIPEKALGFIHLRGRR